MDIGKISQISTALIDGQIVGEVVIQARTGPTAQLLHVGRPTQPQVGGAKRTEEIVAKAYAQVGRIQNVDCCLPVSLGFYARRRIAVEPNE